jgi:hypothetical protein
MMHVASNPHAPRSQFPCAPAAFFDFRAARHPSRTQLPNNSKIGGIHNRIDDEALKRGNLENGVRSVVPNLPPPPERV